MDFSVAAQNVLFDGTTYHMWYSRYEQMIAHAISSDGISWTRTDSSVLSRGAAGNFDETKIGQPSVIKDGDTLKMWYWGVVSGGGTSTNRIGYAWSLDGIIWTKGNGSGSLNYVWDKTKDGGGIDGVVIPTVIKDGTVYRMWYGQFTFNGGLIFRIGYATSTDGITWAKTNGAGPNGSVLDYGATGKFDASGVLPCTVLKTATGFEMWYVGTPAIGYATSPDGIVWTRVPGTATDGSILATTWTSVVKIGGGYKMWYKNGSTREVNYATSTTAGVRNPTPAKFAGLVNYNTASAAIFSMKGRLIQSVSLQGSGAMVNPGNLARGLYLVKAKSPAAISVYKILKN